MKIQNFQNHKRSVLNFSEGLNVIHGDNDQGKSSILRALNWVIYNKPSGFGFQPKNDSDCTTQIEVDSVIRKRNKKENCYIINGKKFSALRSEVPKEVSDNFNLSSFSYQNQYNPHFLFTDSAGEVAKKINRLVGLEEIDKVLSRIKTIKETNNQTIKYLKEEVTLFEEKIEKYEKVDYLWERIQLLQKREGIIENKKSLFEKGNLLVEEINEITDQIIVCSNLLIHKEKLNDLLLSQDSLQLLHEKNQMLSAKITLLNNNEIKFKNYANIEQLKQQMEKVEKIELQIEEQEEDKKYYLHRMNEVNDLSKQIEHQEKQILNLKIEINKEKKRLKICPLCEKPF